MNYELARNLLRLPTEGQLEQSDILRSFSKLSRRYPMQAFPQKNADLLSARDYLLDSSIGLQQILEDDDPDLSWLDQYSKQIPTKAEDPRQEISKKKLLADLMRPVYENAEPDFPADFFRLMNDIL